MNPSIDTVQAKTRGYAWENYGDSAQVILVEKHDRPLVSWMIALRFGNYTDPQGKEGLTQFMGQMLLRGTKKRTRAQIEESLDFLGGSLDVTSGSASFVMDGEILSKNLTAFLELAIDLLTNPTFDEAEIEKQKQENLSQLELKLESDADLARRAFYKAVYGTHPYGRDSLGSKASIRSFTKADLEAHHRKYIHRDRLIIGMAGDLRPEGFRAKVKSIYDALPAGKSEPLALVPTQKVEGVNVILVDKPERTQTHFFIGHPGLSMTDPDYFPLKLFMTAFAGPMFQAQYMKEIRVTRGWSYGAYGSVDARRDGGSVSLYTFPKTQDTVPAIKLSLELLEKAARGDGLPDSSIEFARNYLSRSFPFAVDVPEKVLSEVVYNKLVGKPDDFLEKYVDKIRGITVAQARDAAKRRLNSKDVVISILCSKKDFEATIGKELGAKSVTVLPFDREE